jgi:hypothetical protein
VYQSEFDFLQEMKNAEESDGAGTGQTEDITNILLLQKRL